MPKPFLTAEWRKLAMANYAIDPSVLAPFVPKYTELDFFDNTCYVSLVGFMFKNTKLKGVSIPFHANFEEVNLRFYVKHWSEEDKKWRRGVVFIKEIVPKPALTIVARLVYGEPYQTLPMKHRIERVGEGMLVEYAWKKEGWQRFSVETNASPVDMLDGSEAEFITEHYWGYTRLGERTAEYGVEHPRWQVYTTLKHEVQVDFGLIYGEKFAFLNQLKPKSVFVAEGSEIVVMGGKRLGY